MSLKRGLAKCPCCWKDHTAVHLILLHLQHAYLLLVCLPILSLGMSLIVLFLTRRFRSHLHSPTDGRYFAVRDTQPRCMLLISYVFANRRVGAGGACAQRCVFIWAVRERCESPPSSTVVRSNRSFQLISAGYHATLQRLSLRYLKVLRL